MTPRQLLALAKRRLTSLEVETKYLKAQLASLHKLADRISTEISEAREAVKDRLVDDDGESDERDEEILDILDEQLFPPEAEGLSLHEDWDDGMKRFATGIASLEDAIASR